MDRFREGAIKSIYMENWMAYSGPVILKATPGVNIIAAANGCGKSAIVCAIALGLGFDLNVLARGDNIRSFVKRGCNKAKLKIVLVDRSESKGVTVIERTIVLGTNTPKGDEDMTATATAAAETETETPKSKRRRARTEDDDPDYTAPGTPKVVSLKVVSSLRNEWTINGKTATVDMVKQLQKKLNLQVSNLLTFLAQANVGKFASLSQHELFRSTLNAIEPSLSRDLDSIIEMSGALKCRQSEMQTLVDDLNCATVKISQLKVISETLSKMKDATLYSNLVKQRLYRIKLENLDKGLKATTTRLKSKSEELKQSEEEKVMLDKKLRELTTQVSRLLHDCRTRLSTARTINLFSSSKQGKHSAYAAHLLADENLVDKAYYDTMTALRTFSAEQKPQSSGSKPSVLSRDVIEKRLTAVNKHIELLRMQIAGENELATEIAECRMSEEALKNSLRKLQRVSVRGYEDIQVDNLLRKLNSMKRDGYRQFLRWRREQLDAKTKPMYGTPPDDGSTTDRDEIKQGRRLPKLIISDMKVCGRFNCCIIEEAMNKYMDCMMLPNDSHVSLLSLVNTFKLPSVTVPSTQPVLCEVTERMRSFGVKHFLHELVECNDPDTKLTIASIAQLGTTFVVDEEVFYGWIQNSQADYGGDSTVANSDATEADEVQLSARSYKSATEAAGTSALTTAREFPLDEGNCKNTEDVKGDVDDGNNKSSDVESKMETDSNGDGTLASPKREMNQQGDHVLKHDDNSNPLMNVKAEGQRNGIVDSNDGPSPKNHVLYSQPSQEKSETKSPLKRLSQSMTQDNLESCKDMDISQCSQTRSQRHEEDHFRKFYDCMIEEIGKQVGRNVQILRYYVGTKRHIYRKFKDDDQVYSDYAVEIHTTPSILHDCSKFKTEDTSNVLRVEQELKDVTERLRILSGMLYVRKQDNKVVGGRIYALSREQLSLERTLQAISGHHHGGDGRSSVKRREELDKMQRVRKEELISAIGKRADRIKEWIEKTASRRKNLAEADKLYSQYKSKKKRKERIEELSNICNVTYSEVKAEVVRLTDTRCQQETKHKQYSHDISELNILIKAISGDIVRSTLYDNDNYEDKNDDDAPPATNREREALRVRQEAAAKLDSMTEGDLERELQIAELNVRQLERDDCEEAQTAKEMRDEIIREKTLSNDIAKADADIKDLIKERLQLYENWIARVNSLVSEVDSNFGRYMQQIGDGAAGQVRVEANLDNIKNAKLRVMVKFHADRDLLPLAASYQSGGERGVTTMVYILAVQHLTSNPFFVIDEINQGLDSNYETRIMGLLLRNNVTLDGAEDSESPRDKVRAAEAGKAPVPQYFVLTPQLLPGIDLRGATLHFPLNGSGVVNGLSI